MATCLKCGAKAGFFKEVCSDCSDTASEDNDPAPTDTQQDDDAQRAISVAQQIIAKAPENAEASKAEVQISRLSGQANAGAESPQDALRQEEQSRLRQADQPVQRQNNGCLRVMTIGLVSVIGFVFVLTLIVQIKEEVRKKERIQRALVIEQMKQDSVVQTLQSPAKAFKCRQTRGGKTELFALIGENGESGIIRDSLVSVPEKPDPQQALNLYRSYSRKEIRSESRYAASHQLICEDNSSQDVLAFGEFDEQDNDYALYPSCRNGLLHEWTMQSEKLYRSFIIFPNGAAVRRSRGKIDTSRVWNAFSNRQSVTAALPGGSETSFVCKVVDQTSR